MANQMPIMLPPRHHDAKYALLIMAVFGEFVQGECRDLPFLTCSWLIEEAVLSLPLMTPAFLAV